MTSITVYNKVGEKVGMAELAPAVFGQKRRLPLVFEAVQAQFTNKRQGTVSTKIRSEVRGGGKKPYRQKGTGRARHGSGRSPIFVGGGTTFGPRPRALEHRMPRQAKRAALCSLLSIKQMANKVIVVDQWECEQPKTKPMAAALKKMGVASGLVVMDVPNGPMQKSLRNIRRFFLIINSIS